MSALILLIISLAPWAEGLADDITKTANIKTRYTLWDLPDSNFTEELSQHGGLCIAALLTTCILLVTVAVFPHKISIILAAISTGGYVLAISLMKNQADEIGKHYPGELSVNISSGAWASGVLVSLIGLVLLGMLTPREPVNSPAPTAAPNAPQTTGLDTEQTEQSKTPPAGDSSPGAARVAERP
ncbi:hypothetical protein ACOZ38_14385 [Sphaerisporangium viridialbum]|uniref:hypothetical protein n=1 Tax=Sphaerisporangium viridialbum TaxID=46189 RepID=UPI003C768181